MEYRVVRSLRKTVSIEVFRSGEIIVRCPYFLSDRKISKLVDTKRYLIEKKLSDMQKLPPVSAVSRDEIETLRKRAKEYILPRLDFWSEKTGLIYNGVKITSARGRFGSCNSRGNICFSLFLMLAEPSEIDYVILHELCHTKEMNHSKAFYQMIEFFMPDYKKRQKKLKEIQIPVVMNKKG